MHTGIKNYNRAQTGEDKKICELLAAELDKHLPEAQSKV